MISITLNLIYLLGIVAGIYYGIVTYIHTRHTMIFWGLGILIFSCILELQWINQGKYAIEASDIFRTLRDITRTIVTIL